MSHFLPDGSFFTASISWTNPGTAPVAGVRHLWAACYPAPCAADGTSAHQILKNIENHIPPIKPGCGYALCLDVTGNIKPRKKWSAEAKAKNRLRLMKNRAFKKDPLFADYVIQKKLSDNPGYYCPDQIAKETILHDAQLQKRQQDYREKFIRESIMNATGSQLQRIKERCM